MNRPLVFAVLVTVALAGCSGFINKQAASSTYRILEKSQVAARRQSDVELAREALPGGVMQMEAFALAYPDHRGFRVLHAESVCQLAAAFVFDEWEDASLGGRADEAERLLRRLNRLLGTCVESQLALLPPAWRDAYGKEPATTALLAKLPRSQVPHVLWLATVGAVRIATDPMQHLATLPLIKAMFARCAEVAPGFHDADAEILLGTLQAGQSAIFGGPDGSTWFAAARKHAGEGLLLIDVMFARGPAVAKKDRALFRSTLERVLAARLEAWPERRLSNELAQRKARRYLAAEARLIPE